MVADDEMPECGKDVLSRRTPKANMLYAEA
jgi:hypothetical protein